MIVDLNKDKCKSEGNERKSNTLLIQTNDKIALLENKQKELNENVALSRVQV